MATKRVVIQVQLKGAKTADAGVRKVGETSQKTSKDVDQLRKATDALSPALAKVGSSGGQLGAILAGASGGVHQLDAALRQVNGNGLKFTTVLQQTDRAARTTSPLLDKVRSSTRGTGVEIDRLTQKFRGAGAAQKSYNSGLKQVEAQTRRTEAVSRSLGGVMGRLQLIFATYFSVLGVRKLIETADAFTNLQNRLRLVTTGMGALQFTTNRLFESANNTRTGIEDLALIFQRTTTAASAFGKSQEEILQFTDLLAKSTAISGASAVEASNALRQFSQGLGQNALRGEELNSVLEQIPFIADVIAGELKVTRGELKQLAQKGKIDVETILRAFKNAREEIEGKFAKIIPTVSQAFVVLRNNWVKLVGEFDTGRGITAALARGIIFLGNNLSTVVRVIAGLAIGIGSVVLAMKAATAATALFSLVLAANPITLIAGALAAVIGLLITFSDKIKIAGLGMADLGDLAGAVFDEVLSVLQSVGSAIADVFGTIRDLAAPVVNLLGQAFTSVFGEIDTSFVGVVKGIAKGLDLIVTHFGRMFLVVLRIWEGIAKGGFLLVRSLGGFFSEWASGTVSTFVKWGGAVVGVFAKTFELGTKIGRKALELITGDTQKSVEAIGGTVTFKAPKFEEPKSKIAEFGASLASSLADAATFEFTGFSDAVDRILDNTAKRAEDRRKRQAEKELALAAAAKAATVAPPKTAGATISKEEENALKRLAREMQKLKDKRAELRVELRGQTREAHVLSEVLRIQRVVKRNLTEQEKNRIIALVKETQALQDQIAIKKVTDDLDREKLVLLAKEGVERDILSTILSVEDDLKRKLTATERDSIATRIRANKALEEENAIVERIRGPQEEYKRNVAALTRALDSGRISQKEFNDELRDMRIAALDAQTTLGAGAERALLKFAKSSQDSAAMIEGALTNAFKNAEDAFVEFVKTGKLDFSSLIDSILADLARAAFRQQIGALIGSTGQGGGGASGVLGLFSGLFGSSGANFSSFAGGGLTNSQVVAGVGNPLGFRTGGTFEVGGSGGIDSQLVAFKATPGERVSVSPSRESEVDRNGGTGGIRPIVVNMTINTPDADSFRRSQQQTMARVEAGIRRASARTN